MTSYESGKLDGLKDVVNFLDRLLKDDKKRVETAREDSRKFGMYDDCGDSYKDELIRAEQRFQTILELKISIEKYRKKLLHEIDGDSGTVEVFL